MTQLNGGSINIGQYLVQAGRSLTRAGRLAGMIQVCRPNWSGEASWYAAQSLRQDGVKEYGEQADLTDYLAYLDGCLTRFSRQRYGEHIVADASELEVQRWARRWQGYRDMARAGHHSGTSLAA